MPDIAIPEVLWDPSEERFEVEVRGELAHLSTALQDGRLFLLHTDVPQALAGHGVGASLVRAAMEHARLHQLRVVPFCPFARTFLTRHTEYNDLILPS